MIRNEVGNESLLDAQAYDRAEESAAVLLRRVFRILKGCGISADQLENMSTRALAEVEAIADAHPSRVTARQGLMCCDVVLKWRRDCRFLDNDGLPRSLALEGDSHTFAQLVEVAAPGQDPKQFLSTMIELGVVRVCDDAAQIELISDSVVACSGRDGSLVASECVLEHICGFLGSVEYNVFDKPSRARGRFERACYAVVPRNLVPVLENLVSSRGQDFVDVLDEWLARRSSKTAGNEDVALVGAGAYVFVREDLSR